MNRAVQTVIKHPLESGQAKFGEKSLKKNQKSKPGLSGIICTDVLMHVQSC